MRAVFFDLDMTLIETRADLAASANEVRRQLGLAPLSSGTIEGYIGDGVKELLQRVLGDASYDPDDALSRFRAHYWDHCVDATFLYPGIPELLDALGDRPLAVVSNKPERFCRYILEQLGVSERFDTIVGGDSAVALKPDPAPLLLAAECLDVDVTAATMVGDTWRDVRAGKAAGCRTIAVTYGLDAPERLRQEGPDGIVGDVPALTRALT